MKIKLPLIGQITTGLDKTTTKVVPKEKKEKFFDILGGFLDFAGQRLSNEKTVSTKILEANKDWVYRNNDVIAKEVSKMEFELYSIGLEAGEIVYNEIEEHPLLDLLDRFNGDTTKSDAIYTTQSHKKLTGDAFWLMEKNGAVITNIYLLEPDKIELIITPTAGEDEGRFVTGYRYRDTVNGRQIDITYSPDQIIHFKTPNPRNQFRGYGVVEAIAQAIDTDNLTNETQKNFFKKGAITNFVLTTEGKLTEEQLKRLKAELRSSNLGAQNAFEALILSGGLTPANISYSNKDMQFLDILTWYRDKIMVCFGNTKASLGIVDDVNRASFEGSFSSWLSNSVKPDMDAIVNTLNEFLVPLFGPNLVLGYEDPVPEDRTDDVNEAITLKNSGIITINEARELADLESIEGGDIFAPQGNVVSPTDANPEENDNQADQADEDKSVRKQIDKSGIPHSLSSINLKKILRRYKLFTRRQVYKEIKENAKPLIREMLKNGKKVKVEVKQLHPQMSNEIVMAYYEKQIFLVHTFETKFEEAVKKFIGKIEKRVMSQLDSEIQSKKGIQKQFLEDSDYEDFQVEAQLDLTPILMQEVVLAGQEAYKLIGVEDIYIPYKIHDAIAKNVAKFTASMLDTDREALINIISNGLEGGLSVPEIRGDITAKFEDITKVQAERVTRTEVMRASNMASEDAFIQSGVVESKEWLCDGAPCEECEPHDGETIELGGDFYESDDFSDGDPPLHPNCECVILPVVMGSEKILHNLSVKETGELKKKIDELEKKIDKRTKEFKELKVQHGDDAVYIKSLEKYLGVDDEKD